MRSSNFCRIFVRLFAKPVKFVLAFLFKISYNDKCFRDVAQVVERYFREVEAAGSSPVIPICSEKSNRSVAFFDTDQSAINISCS